ncbi:hypothetical protein BC830DRAFT_51093 [Chytriomyces sp. MP71]|nr:hypothetical protein BC830DRAFT_51093 [Chytriomyces sp. MP71]
MDSDVCRFVVTAMRVLWTEAVDPFASLASCSRQQQATVAAAIASNPTTPPLSPTDEALWHSHKQHQQQLEFDSLLAKHISKLLSPTTMNAHCIALALLLISRLRQLNKADTVRPGAEPHLLSTAFLLALKVLDDWRIDAVAWVPYCNLELATINAMEREFLAKIAWKVHVSRSEFNAFLDFLTALDESWSLSTTVFPIPKHHATYYRMERQAAMKAQQCLLDQHQQQTGHQQNTFHAAVAASRPSAHHSIRRRASDATIASTSTSSSHLTTHSMHLHLHRRDFVQPGVATSMPPMEPFLPNPPPRSSHRRVSSQTALHSAHETPHAPKHAPKAGPHERYLQTHCTPAYESNGIRQPVPGMQVNADSVPHMQMRRTTGRVGVVASVVGFAGGMRGAKATYSH